MSSNIWNERVFLTVLKLPFKPLLLFLFFFFFMPPAGNVVDGLAFECFLVAVRAQINVMTKEVKKKKKTRKLKELKTSAILDLLFLSYLS